MCFPLFHFHSLILLPSHHTSEVDDALAVWVVFFFLPLRPSSHFELASFSSGCRIPEVKDVLCWSPTGASVSGMSGWDNAPVSGLTAGLGSGVQGFRLG